jgi:enoyl-CoA hydratase/carnithine racemase
VSPKTKLGRSWSLLITRVNDRYRKSTKWITVRRRQRLAFPPATPVIVERLVHGVLEIRLASGDRRNVLGRSTIDRIEEIVASPPHGTRVIVITAEPPDFCAGYDIVEASRGDVAQLMAHEKNFSSLRSSLVPIVMALQGNVIGGGLELALLADVRVASPEAKFAIPASKLGLIYSEAGARLVVDAFGESMARSMFLGGRVVTAEDALNLGVVSVIVGREQLRNEALELAAGIASWSSEATSGNRQVLDVIAGRIDVNTEELHQLSFDPKGALAESIAQFVARRTGTTHVPLPKSDASSNNEFDNSTPHDSDGHGDHGADSVVGSLGVLDN